MHFSVNQARKMAEGHRCRERGGNNGLRFVARRSHGGYGMHFSVNQARKMAEGHRCRERGENNGLRSISHFTLGEIQLELVDVTPAPFLSGLK